ncbi:MAG: cell division protein FtsA, partial [Alphaproteobacteria bacterium]
DPRGMFGERLGVEMHRVTAATGALRNLSTCVARCHLSVEANVVAPYASGLACLVADERKLGTTVIDMGGGTTSFAVFIDGHIVYSDCVPVGGQHVTNDIARGLSTPIAHAERMKTLYGSALVSASDEREVIDVPRIGESGIDHANHVPRSLLIGIIRPRLEETLELVRDRLEAAGFDRISGRRVVLTGGASQLQGAVDLAALILDKQARIGRPVSIAGLAEATGGPAFSTAAGLLTYAVENPTGIAEGLFAPSANDNQQAPTGFIGKAGEWLRQNF